MEIADLCEKAGHKLFDENGQWLKTAKCDIGDLTNREQAVLGPPQRRKKASVLTFELRRRFHSGVAISPSIQYETIRRIAAVSVPFYFLRSEKGRLNGGLRANWRSDTKTITISIFVGTVLSTIPGT